MPEIIVGKGQAGATLSFLGMANIAVRLVNQRYPGSQLLEDLHVLIAAEADPSGKLPRTPGRETVTRQRTSRTKSN